MGKYDRKYIEQIHNGQNSAIVEVGICIANELAEQNAMTKMKMDWKYKYSEGPDRKIIGQKVQS